MARVRSGAAVADGDPGAAAPLRHDDAKPQADQAEYPGLQIGNRHRLLHPAAPSLTRRLRHRAAAALIAIKAAIASRAILKRNRRRFPWACLKEWYPILI
jgi:hypothetical protein